MGWAFRVKTMSNQIKLSNKTTEDQLIDFQSLVQEGMTAWVRAGEILVSIIDSGSMALDQISNEIPLMNRRTLATFEKIGRKQIVPGLLLASYPAARAAARLPYSEQRRTQSEKIEVATSDGSDVMVAIEDMTQSQTRQVFNDTGIRSLAGQRAWIESQRTRRAAEMVAETPMPYTVRGKTVTFVRGAKLEARELAALLAAMTK
jgi:hypothetical protein